MDYYAILGVHPTAEDIVIRAAYKALAQRYHPDRFAGSKDEAHRRMSDLTKAYEVLADPVRRQKYDRRRLTYTQSVATYFNGSTRFPPPALDPRELRSVAAKRKRSRIALSTLMIAVVVLSTFNLYQYSAQLKDWLSASLPASPHFAEANSRRVPDPSVAATLGAASGDSPRSATAARIANPSVGQSDGPAAHAAVAEAQVPPSPRSDASLAEVPHAKGPGETLPRQPGADASRGAPLPYVAPPAAAPPAAAPVAAAPVAAAPVAAAPPAAAPPAAAPPAAAALLREGRRASATAARARSAPVDRPITTPPAAPASDTCRDAVAALGLCSPSTTARNK